MNAVRLHDHGGIDALRYEDVPRPEPGAGELRVRVRAAGVPIDWLVGRGDLVDLLDESLPWIPGWDLSGIVGSDVTGFDPGDDVFDVGGRARG